MKKIFLLSLLLCFILLSLSAQSDYAPGYIVKNNGDTLRGRIFLSAANMYSSKCVFRLNETASDERYTPGDLKSFKLDDGEFFVSRDINLEGHNNKVFLEWLVKGKINLFVYCFPGNANRYFIESIDPDLLLKFSVKHLRTQDKTGRKDYPARLDDGVGQ